MIRKAKLTDIPAIIHLGQELTRSGEWSYTTIDFTAAVGRLRQAVTSIHEWVGIAEHRGRVVGFMILVSQPMWWNPKQRQVVDDILYCARPGMGRALVKAGLKWAWSDSRVAEVILSLNSGLATERATRALCKYGLRPRGVTLSVGRPEIEEAKKWAA